MEFDTLKKSHKKQIVIGALAVCVIGGALTFSLTRAKYRVTQSYPLVKGTINYKVPDLRIVTIKTSEDGKTYTDVEDVPTSGYQLNEEKSICRVYDGSTTPEEAPKDTNITIEYAEGKINFLGVGKRNTRCYLYFDKKTTSEDTLAKLNINPSYIKSGNPNFAATATGAETVADNGIYKMADPMYGENAETYYWRGAATSNHVIFANKCWRIIRINGDGSIRLIYNGATNGGAKCNANPNDSVILNGQKYNVLNNNSSYAGWTYEVGKQRPDNSALLSATDSNTKTQVEKWFNDNTNFTDSQRAQVVEGKYCNDRNVKSGQTWADTEAIFFQYAGSQRLVDNKNPSLECETEDVYILKIGIIQVDEVSMAGGVFGINNASYYLNNSSYSYWTMSPYFWDGSDGSYVDMFVVRINGAFNNSGSVSSTSHGIRPVINLRSDVTFNSGSDGTQNNPYVVS